MKAAFYTLGCKVNQAESEYMTELLKNAGFDIVSPGEEADYYIINSCTVTATADQKTRQSVRRFKRKHPNSTVILTGCMPQAFPEEAKGLAQADIILGNKNDGDILALINRHAIEKNKIISISEHTSGEAFAPCSLSSFGGRVRAFVKIEDGCDRFCSYCIIPKSRGRVRSKPLENIKDEVRKLAENGIKEIVLVGINLSAYGKGTDLCIADAVEVCADVAGISRVRLGSLEPDHITDEIIERLTKVKKFCPQFHISLQSGCNKTLKNMNRHYTAEEYETLCTKLRGAFQDCSLTTDIMVGFHEESEKDFEESLAFVKKIAFEKVHVFPYSQRTGTAASKRGDSVKKSEKEKRAEIMINETEKIRQNYLEKLIGKDVEVLVEGHANEKQLRGYTKNYTPILINSESDLIGLEIKCTVTGVESDECIANLDF